MSVAPVRVWGISLARCALWFLALDSYLFAMSAWCLQKQVKNNAGKKECRLAVILMPFSSSKYLLIIGQKRFSGWWLAYMKHAKVMQKVLLELSLLGVWKKYYGDKTALQCRFFWSTRIRWGWSATITEGRAHFSLLVSLRLCLGLGRDCAEMHYGTVLVDWFCPRFPRNSVVANERSISIIKTIPSCNSAQHRPILPRNLKMANK